MRSIKIAAFDSPNNRKKVYLYSRVDDDSPKCLVQCNCKDFVLPIHYPGTRSARACQTLLE
ncbi:hypothetical protein NEOLI_004765 [Neolecta irregularis DAH-3]|uniref:Uncharacterized protein n=1 Tax=Neolecta irregularis (strain DAH-3) TaxID=1198029 RepID=A0A1U7LK14_NEOID|nr:hypothetical protein NEOLI_004765 [Neolecta irregularis DAH-3]|eukprot:OLL22933.1 hypothetical protein NEOLI_004765 [Neolecta irregularis DAH-3]